jgi:uncharacterized iron-regulated membrane protein
MTVLDESEAPAPKETGTYHFIWRWHFYAGLFVAPFLIILALTGSMILFDRQIESVIYRPLVQVAPSSTQISPAQQETLVLQANPGARVLRYVHPEKPDYASEFLIRNAEGKNRTIFVDPKDGRIKGDMNSDTRFSSVVTDIHGNLMAGPNGSLLVEFAGCWGFVLLVSGLFLWWPRKDRKVGVAAPRLKAKGRGFWRDLILSGLPWSGFWGNQLAKLGTLNAATAPTPNFVAPPPALGVERTDAFTGHIHDHDPVKGDLPWAVKKAGLPEALPVALDHAHMHHAMSPADLAFLTNLAAERGILAPGLRVLYPGDEKGVFTLSFVPATAQGQRTINVDPATRTIIQDIGWEQYSPLGKAVEFGVETHVGKQFGLPNQLVLLASCLVLIATICFGIVMWLRRRPAGKIGAPPVPAGFRPNAVLFALILFFGLIFPLVGASMLLIWLADLTLLRRRAPPV